MTIDNYISKDTIAHIERDMPEEFYGTMELKFQNSQLKVVSVISTFLQTGVIRRKTSIMEMTESKRKRPWWENLDADDPEDDFEKPDDLPEEQHDVADDNTSDQIDDCTGETEGLNNPEPSQRIVTCDELAKIVKNTPIMKPLVKDLIAQQSLGILVGRWGLGKSPLLIQLALSIASGISFLGNYATSKGNVLYVDFENGEVDPKLLTHG